MSHDDPDLFATHIRRMNQSRSTLKSFLVLFGLAITTLFVWLCIAEYDKTVVCSGHFAPDLLGRNENGDLPRFLQAKSASEIKRMEIREGREFGKGDVLVELAAKEYFLQLEGLDAKIRSLKLRRFIPSKNELDDDVTYNLRMAEVERSLLIERLEDRKIVAPYDGVVVSNQAVQGDWVSEGSSVLEIAPLTRKFVFEAHVPSSEIGTVEDGDSVDIFPKTFDRLHDSTLSGRVIKSAEAAERKSGSLQHSKYFLVTIEMDSDLDELRVRNGTIGECTIHSKAANRSTLLSVLFNRFYPHVKN